MGESSLMQNIVQRENYLDVAKGIALFGVVLGHLVNFGGTAFTWIFSFHMMLFFFISGYQFNSNKYINYKFTEYFDKKVKTILIPYVIVTIIGIIACIIIPSWRGFGANIYYYLFYLAQPENLQVGQIWFLACLFWTEILFFYFYKKMFSHLHTVSIIFIIILISIVGFNMNLVSLFTYPRIPWKLDSSITALVFYSTGFYTKRIGLIDKLYEYSKFVSAIILISCGVLGFYIAEYKNGYVNISDCQYGNYIYFYIAAFCGILFVMLFSKYLANNKILQYYGRNTLWMFSLHSFLLYISVYILNLITQQHYIRMSNIPFVYCLIIAIIIYLTLGLIPFVIKYCKKIKLP
ncbi:MAG: acyltransferase family protein [Anaerofustis sp.]